MTHRALKTLPKQDSRNIYAIMKHWLCGNSCTWAHDVLLHIAGTNEPRVLNKQSKEHNITTDIMLLTLFSTLG